MKKGQGTEALLFILGGVIMALAIYYGVSSVMNVQQKGAEAGLLLLESTIKNGAKSGTLNDRNHTRAIALTALNVMIAPEVQATRKQMFAP